MSWPESDLQCLISNVQATPSTNTPSDHSVIMTSLMMQLRLKSGKYGMSNCHAFGWLSKMHMDGSKADFLVSELSVVVKFTTCTASSSPC